MPRSQVVLSVVGGLVGLVFAVLLYQRFGVDTGAPAQPRGFVVVSDTAVRVQIEVARDPGARVFCVLRARDRTGAEVGRLSFDVPPSRERTAVVEREVATRGRAVTGELVGCAEGRARPAP